MIDPDENPDAWETALIAGELTPGLAKITSGGEYALGWDKKKGTGTSGASTVFTGEELPGCTVQFRFAGEIGGLDVQAQRRRFYDVIVPLLQKSRDGKTALEFYHAAVSDPPCNLKSVVLESIGPMKNDAHGVSTVEVKLLRFVKPKPAAVGKPKASKTKTPGTTAKDDLDLQLEALTDQWNAL